VKLPGLTARTARAGRNERRTRRALALAVGLTAMLALAQLALAATERAASMPSTVLAGYDFTYYIGVPGNVSATIVVPKLSCMGTPSTGSAIDAGVGIQSVNSYARLALACTPQGVASYTPSLVVNGTTKNIASDRAQPGDTVVFVVSQSDTIDTVSVIDLTHKFNATSNGSGSGTGQGILAGDFPAVSGGTTLPVPNFGTLAFTAAVTNGYPLGDPVATYLQTDDLTVNSKVQIKTTISASNKEAFTTAFA
jgi:Peptidase A4 family